MKKWYSELNTKSTPLKIVTVLYLSLYLIMFCYRSPWHLKDLAVKEHTLDWRLWPLLTAGTWFSVLAQSSDRCTLLFSAAPPPVQLCPPPPSSWFLLEMNAHYSSLCCRSMQLATESNAAENLTSSPTALVALANTRLDCDQGKSAWLAHMEGRQYHWLKGIQHNVSTVCTGEDRGKRFCPNSYLMSLFPFPPFTW